MQRSSFSIVIPIHGKRDGRIPIWSLLNQRYPRELFEILVIEDDNAKCCIPTFVVAHHDQRLERAISRNEGMKAATNDWVIWLDSDDELVSTALYNLDYWIRKCPAYKIFHYGGIVFWEPNIWDEKDYEPRTSIRPTPNLEEDEKGMKPFKTGLIAAGHFCFKREIFEELGGLPKEMSPYVLADKAKEEFPEFKDPKSPFYLVDTLGNPWGDDYYFFYKITRKYKSKGLPLNLYIQHVRR